MPQYVAFLRAINVGGHIVKMDRLRRLFEELGFDNVETFIASGQVIFDSKVKDTARLEAKIEKHLKDALGYNVETFIRTPAELAKIAEQVDPGDATLYIGFLADKPSKAARDKLMTFRTDTDDFEVHDREVYWIARKNMSESTFSGARLEKALGMPSTMRNANTIRRLVAKYG